ncbi:type VI secretion system-associated FHA domain protein TagH [Methylococcus sp. EFPC2]|uniref:type VI secretion system-associated FHA domain protein TagH n=1 Tax=Methylococcus sp. EFPC2 TaxID=2812648 RepID=UPI0019673AE1|nr:type VI secretion system-associated FHA domain protein TagH [Methylococcus sp. EFPC2]QSA96410.1 type VI secretion system-associated FHA domain protein TagH [Methylococcus sp. EFPC2]
MPLTLTVLSYKGLPPPAALSARFDGEGGSIGRSPDNGLSLPDAEKFISRKHAEIVFERGVYRLADTSTAGTYLAREDRLLQHESVELADGDRLKIGEYELLVSLQPEEAGAQAYPPAFGEAGRGEFPQSPFALDEQYFEPIAIPPLETGSVPAPPVSPTSPFESSFLDQADSSPFRESFTPPGLESPAPAELPDFDLEDLLKDFEEAPLAQAPPVWEARPDVPPAPFPPLAEESEPAPPAAVPELRSAPFSIPTPGRVPAEAPALRQESVPPPAATAEAGPSGGDAELFRRFLQGAGIADTAFMADEDQGAAMETVGQLFRDLVAGMMVVLRARSELKSQFRVAVTTIRPVNNNPLKFTVNVEEAVKTLVARNRPGFIDSAEAVREGYDDIMNHQLAMTAGIQASLTEIVKRFDPQRYEKSYEEGIVFQKKAKCWDAYCKAYPEEVAQALENFFGDEFAEVYEQQMRILRSPQNKN